MSKVKYKNGIVYVQSNPIEKDDSNIFGITTSDIDNAFKKFQISNSKSMYTGTNYGNVRPNTVISTSSDKVIQFLFNDLDIQVLRLNKESITISLNGNTITRSLEELKVIKYSESTIEDFILMVLFCYNNNYEFNCKITNPLYVLYSRTDELKVKELDIQYIVKDDILLCTDKGNTKYVYNERTVNTYKNHIWNSDILMNHYLIFPSFFEFINKASNNFSLPYRNKHILTINKIYDFYKKRSIKDKE